MRAADKWFEEQKWSEAAAAYESCIASGLVGANEQSKVYYRLGYAVGRSESAAVVIAADESNQNTKRLKTSTGSDRASGSGDGGSSGGGGGGGGGRQIEWYVAALLLGVGWFCSVLIMCWFANVLQRWCECTTRTTTTPTATTALNNG